MGQRSVEGIPTKNDPHFGLACHFLSGTLPLARSGAEGTFEGTSTAVAAAAKKKKKLEFTAEIAF